MKTQFYLARHGETIWNRMLRFQGQLDSELTENGRQQAGKIAERLQNSNIKKIVSSPLGRAVNSAKICQQTLKTNYHLEPGLVERHLGQWQGQMFNQLQHQAHFIDIFQRFSHHKPTGGESAISCAERIYQTLIQIAQKHTNQNLLVIFHGEALRCLLAKLGYNVNASAYDLFNNGDIIALTYDHFLSDFQLSTEQIATTL